MSEVLEHPARSHEMQAMPAGVYGKHFETKSVGATAVEITEGVA